MQAMTCIALVLTMAAGLLVGCATAPASRSGREAGAVAQPTSSPATMVNTRAMHVVAGIVPPSSA